MVDVGFTVVEATSVLVLKEPGEMEIVVVAVPPVAFQESVEVAPEIVEVGDAEKEIIPGGADADSKAAIMAVIPNTLGFIDQRGF